MYLLLESTPVEYLEMAEAILDKAKAVLNREINESVLAGLTDHLHFAIDRQQKGNYLPNLIQQETRLIYPKEFEVGLWALRMIYTKTGIQLPQDEAGYIAIHILNASTQGDSDVGEILTFIKEVLDIVEGSCSLSLNRESLDYYRITTHLKYFYQRMMNMEKVEMRDVDDMYQLLLKKHQHMEVCISNIVCMLEEEYDYSCTKSEQVYLMMHILKML